MAHVTALLAFLFLGFDPAATDVSLGGGYWSGREGACIGLDLYQIPDDEVHLTVPVCLVRDGGSMEMDSHWFHGPSGWLAALSRLEWQGRSGDVEAGLLWGTRRTLDTVGAHGLYLTLDPAVPRPVLETGFTSTWLDGSAWVEGLDVREGAGGALLVGPGWLRGGVRFSTLRVDHAAVDGGLWYSPWKSWTIGVGYRRSDGHGAFVSVRHVTSWSTGSFTLEAEGAGGDDSFVPFLISPLALVRAPRHARIGGALHVDLRWHGLGARVDLLENQGLQGSASLGWGTAGRFYAEGALAFDEDALLVSGSARWLVYDPWFVGVLLSTPLRGDPIPTTVMVSIGVREYWFRP